MLRSGETLRGSLRRQILGHQPQNIFTHASRRQFRFDGIFIRHRSFELVLRLEFGDHSRCKVREVCLEQHAHDGALDVREELLEPAKQRVRALGSL